MPVWLSRPALVVLCALPLLAVVLLSAPAWLTWPFLPAGRQEVVLAVLDRLVQWARAAVSHADGGTERAMVE
ncbi:hypothetical protein [Streptomyces sp. AF1A]|jgi:hypothetical protein|uniref:hypothetical protein n=1 Tax=Streptomyces sp. AF1A TaxID=3394350 RepID=UPI0039BCF418